MGEMRLSMLKYIEADVEFLKANNIMDYSLMVGVHNVSSGICCLDSAQATFQVCHPSASMLHRKTSNMLPA